MKTENQPVVILAKTRFEANQKRAYKRVVTWWEDLDKPTQNFHLLDMQVAVNALSQAGWRITAGSVVDKLEDIDKRILGLKAMLQRKDSTGTTIEVKP